MVKSTIPAPSLLVLLRLNAPPVEIEAPTDFDGVSVRKFVCVLAFPICKASAIVEVAVVEVADRTVPVIDPASLRAKPPPLMADVQGV